MADLELDGLLSTLISSAFEGLDGDTGEPRVGTASEVVGQAEVTAEIHLETGSWFGELCFIIDAPNPYEVAQRVMNSLPEIAIAEWKLVPKVIPLHMHTKLALNQLHPSLGGSWIEIDKDRPSHIVRETELVDALVVGRVLRAMCGYTFTPTETGEEARQREVCPRCALVVKTAMVVVDRLDDSTP